MVKTYKKKTEMKKVFSTVPRAKIRKSGFNLDHERKLSGDFGKLYPILVEEVVPGDTFSISSEVFIRLAPMIAPVMHRINAYVHFFYVPNFLLWKNWEKFITEESELTVPKIDVNNQVIIGSLADHLGIPTGNYSEGGGVTVNALPFRAYSKIWNDYYRDQNLEEEIDIEGGQADTVFQPVATRKWEKDYFTSSLPFAQKGESVNVTGTPVYKERSEIQSSIFDPEDPIAGNLHSVGQFPEGGGALDIGEVGSSFPGRIENLDGVEVNINELRIATRVQRWLERSARSGSRYIEHLLAHWGIISDDLRLQRAEYIGGGKTPVVVSEVLQMAGEAQNPNRPLGDLAGHGLSIGKSNTAKKHCKYHGWIFGILSVMPTTNYLQGLHKKFSRLINFDYYYPEFAQLGEQAVLMKELYLQGNEEDEETFGYQGRWNEMRYGTSTVHGDFRQNLEFYHLARKFENKPQLNTQFVECHPDSERIFATDDKDYLWINIYNRVRAIRPMPYQNDPTL